VWTPRRILIFFSMLGVFLVAFTLYYFFLGVYDGLAPLPERYQENVKRPPPPPPVEPEYMQRLREAFGNECEELDKEKRKSQTWLPSKSMVLAIGKMVILKNGRVLLTPFSAGIFGKPKPNQRFPEINTVQCDEAYLTLDRAITSLGDIGKSKLVAVELTGASGIKIVNNRGTIEKHDDLELYIAPGGRLFYEEARNLIWTDDAVRMLDTQTQPLPTLVTGIGMEVLLAKETSPNAPKKDKTPAPGKKDGASGVEKITLRSNVDMHLYLDSRSGFMTGTEGPAKKDPAAKADPNDKMHVQVTTNGKFVYDMIRDTARFDSPTTKGPLEDRVKVTRNMLAPKEPPAPAPAPPMLPPRIDPVAAPVALLPPTTAVAPPKVRTVDDFDVLICDHLDLQFRSKLVDKTPAKTPAPAAAPPAATPPAAPAPAKAAGAPGQDDDKEIEFAIATADAPQTVRMKMIAEDMDADAVEMRYFAATLESGPRSILKGQPVIAYRQGHRIECPELHLKGADKDGNGQEGFAKGPGRLDLLDKNTGKRSTHIFWKNSLTSTKDRDGNRLFDLLTLRGDPFVIDDERKQDMRAAQYLHLWLEQTKDTSPGAKEGATKQNPYKILGIETVSLHSPDLIIHNARVLNVIFSRKTASAMPGPIGVVAAPIPPAGPGPPPTMTTGLVPKEGAGFGTIDPVGPPSAKSAVPEKKDKEKNGKPIEITANEVIAFIADSGEKKELLEMLCRHEVHIHQDPEVGKEKEKGLDITGELVDLKRAPEGDILHVLGDRKKLAQLQSGEMLLFGPNITIDQILNRATVEGGGALNMPSNKTLDGKPKEGRLTVHWSTQMVFNGSLANFDGNVEAFQDTGRLLSQSMQVTLDHPIDFKKGQRGDQKSAVDKIVCDSPPPKRVYVIDEEREPNGKLITFKRLQLQVMEVDNKDQRMDGSARGIGGVLDFIGRGNDDAPLGKTEEAKTKPPGQKKGNEPIVFKWTRVRFAGSMQSYVSQIGNGRKTTFREQVRVFHQPGSDPDAADPTTASKGSLYLTCEKLDVVSRKVGDKTYQEMFADGGDRLVNFVTDEFTGNAKTMKFNEETDILIFEGSAGVLATVYRLPKVQGGAPQTLQGRKILYNRKSGEFNVDGATVISSWLTPVDPPKIAKVDALRAMPTALRGHAWNLACSLSMVEGEDPMHAHAEPWAWHEDASYSHSIVAGGLLLMS
jgi:lipopolysaccharide export system protein LptA